MSDIDRAAAFWTSALDLVAATEWASPEWRTLWHRDGSGRTLGLMLSESPVEPRPRLHLDLFVDTTAEQEAEVGRRAGRDRVGWGSLSPEPDFVVLADPDGNLFCVVDLSTAPSGPGTS